MKQVIVTVLPLANEQISFLDEGAPVLPADDECVDGTCDTDSGPAAVPDKMTLLMKSLAQLKSEFGDTVRIDVVDYEDSASMQRGMDRLNLALETAGAEPLDTSQRFAMFVNSSAPIVIIENRLSFTGIVPTPPQLIGRVKAALR